MADESDLYLITFAFETRI